MHIILPIHYQRGNTLHARYQYASAHYGLWGLIWGQLDFYPFAPCLGVVE